MAILSIDETLQSAANAIKRFPISVFAAYVAAMLLIAANHFFDLQNFIGGYVATAVFAFPLALAVDLFFESRKAKSFAKNLARVLVVAVLIAMYFFVFRFFDDWEVADVMRFVILNLAAISLVLFSPFVSEGKMNGFWQFVITLFIRFVQAFFFFGILFAGIAALMASVDFLFEVQIPDQYYFDVWQVITGVMVSTFLLAGVPANFQALDRVTSYPKFLRVLTEYFLVPLVFLYMLVLYVYFGKILVTFNWPNGGVAWWIIGFSFVGVVTYFLAHSVKEAFMRHVEFFRKWFFVALIPLIAVLFMAVYIRISEYGITEPRYFVFMYGIWLFVLCAYFIYSKAKSLKFIPAMLFAFLLFSSYGPQSAFDVAKVSQIGRLENLLEKNGMLKDGKVVSADLNVVDQRNVQDIGNVVYYLADHHGVDVFQPWFEEDLDTYVVDPDGGYVDVSRILDLMGLKGAYYDAFLGYGADYAGDLYLNFSKVVCYEGICPVDVSGYDKYAQFYAYSYTGEIGQSFSVDGKQYKIALEGEKSEMLVLRETACAKCALLAEIDLKNLLESLVLEYGAGSSVVLPEKLVVNFNGGQIRLDNIMGVFKRDPKGELDKDEEFVRIESLNGEILLKNRPLLPPA